MGSDSFKIKMQNLKEETYEIYPWYVYGIKYVQKETKRQCRVFIKLFLENLRQSSKDVDL